MVFSWHLSEFERFCRLLPQLPHAILIHGAAGTGKLEFAKEAAALLLCRSPAQRGNAQAACGECASCTLLRLGNHPDFFHVQPEADAAGTADATEAGEPGGEKRKKLSSQIRIEQIRDLTDSIQTGTHQGGRRVLLISPAEAMNKATANALLKTLEEPPPGTVILLVSGNPDRLLPTLRSRCQRIALGEPDRDLALGWLKQQGVADPEGGLALAGGAPLRALEAAGAEAAIDHDYLIQRLALSGDAFAAADAMVKSEPIASVDWMQRWVCDVLMLQLGGRIRYHPRYEKEIRGVAQKAPPLSLLRFARRLAEFRAIASHPVNPRLFAENLALGYVESVRGPR